jgi:hypothetical protein
MIDFIVQQFVKSICEVSLQFSCQQQSFVVTTSVVHYPPRKGTGQAPSITTIDFTPYPRVNSGQGLFSKDFPQIICVICPSRMFILLKSANSLV